MDKFLDEYAPVSNRLVHQNVWRSLDRVGSALGWTQEQLLQRLSMTEEEYLLRKLEGDSVPAHVYLILAEELNLDLEDLVAGKVDYLALAKQSGDDPLFLRQRYSEGAFSRRRTSLHLLSFSDDHFGYQTTDRLLRKLQVNRAIFEDPEALINIQFLIDACEFFVKKGISASVLQEMGARSAIVNRNTAISQALGKCSSIKEAFDLQINHLMNLYEKNCDYHLHQMTATSCIIESNERADTLDALHSKHVGSPLTCLTRAGVASAIPTFLDLPRSVVVETHCVHRGDPYCRFAVNFEYSAFVDRRRRARRDANQAAFLS